MKLFLSVILLPVALFAQEGTTLKTGFLKDEEVQKKRFRAGLVTPYNTNAFGAEIGVYITDKMSLGFGGGTGKFHKDDKSDSSIPHDVEINSSYTWNQLSLKFDFPVATGFTISAVGGADHIRGRTEYKYYNSELVDAWFFKYNRNNVKGTNEIDINTYAYFARVDFMYTVFFRPIGMTLETGGGLALRHFERDNYEITLPDGRTQNRKLSQEIIQSTASTFVNFIF